MNRVYHLHDFDKKSKAAIEHEFGATERFLLITSEEANRITDSSISLLGSVKLP